MTTKERPTYEEKFKTVDTIWDSVMMRENLAYEGSWFMAYNPAGVSAVARRYQFWETDWDNPDPDLEALANRPRAENDPEFRGLCREFEDDLYYAFVTKKQNLVRDIVKWNVLIQYMWEERKAMMEYVPTTSQKDPLLPWPELKRRQHHVDTPHGRVRVQVLHGIDHAISIIEEIPESDRHSFRTFAIEHDPGSSFEQCWDEAHAAAPGMAEKWANEEP